MRLTQIKLSGFKSFVDPTQFQVPGQLVGVVGPNGCGKSNIIDATRWVLGESKASELRGESMQDVIFNGTNTRKPAGRASVELVFDNALGRAAGQWSQYAEISVKRVLTRDGNSTYLINNQPVRRRDVQDIFLGTGLGPRAYAIIGQGMISRIIEAKPDELRVFLEEAAGVSKYKERRRETENRLHDTRENLTRVEDILRELGGNLEKLEAQAVIAERYKGLQADGDQKLKLLWLLRQREAEAEREKVARDIEQAQIALEAQTADLRSVEAKLEELRQAGYAAADAVSAAQGAYFNVNTEVSRLEAEIRAVVDKRNFYQEQLVRLAAQATQWQTQGEDYSAQLDSATGSQEEVEARAAESEERAALAADRIPEQENEVREGRALVMAAQAAVAEVQKGLEVESNRQRGVSQSLQGLAVRRERLEQETRGLQAPDSEKLEAQSEQLAMLEERLHEAQAQLDDARAEHPKREQGRAEAQTAAQRESAALAQIEARLAALRQLQNDVAHKGKLQPWLEKHGLDQMPRLWQRIDIEPGWETALESALRERVAALEVGQIERAKAFFNDAPPAKLQFYAANGVPAVQAAPEGLKSLLELVKLNDPGLRALLADWLAQVFVADDIDDALARRAKLPAGAMFVVRAGHVVARNSIGFYAADDEQAGMLARQHEIDNLGRQIRAQGLLAEEARGALVRAEAALTQSNTQVQELNARVSQLTRDHGNLRVEVLKLEQARQQYEARSGQIRHDLDEIRAQEEELQATLEESQQRFEELDAKLGEVQSHHEDEQIAQEGREEQLAQARDALREAERAAQEAVFAVRNQKQRIADLERNRALAEQQAAELAAQREAQQLELALLDDEAAQAGLQEALARKADAEDALARARDEQEAVTAQLRGADETRMKADMGLQPLRDRITELQLKEQAARLNKEQFEQQLAEAQADLEALAAILDAEEGKRYRASSLQGEITRINNEIAALGAVNLAALDELKAARERKEFLDAQQKDLIEAITTLEDAIRKIDGETRALLKETFDNVNTHFGRLFPELFGGGEAKLIVTGEEILDAGVQVMAQPPGKKNSTIHLLSGGEKALTAIALVFAIFQLNPAPFCLLDEVDAPLDDANTERFANMVKKMSSVTQFLFISHNKIAMEMAEQLIGVTMQEQGVSRIVAVDMESAARMVEPGAKVAA